MSLTPSPDVDAVRKIEFADALRRLQGLLGREIRVLISFRGTFGGASMEGRLSRVETLPPDDAAVNILLDDRQGIMLDPIDMEVLLVGDPGGDRSWLEFHLPSGVAVVLEPDLSFRAPGS